MTIVNLAHIRIHKQDFIKTHRKFVVKIWQEQDLRAKGRKSYLSHTCRSKKNPWMKITNLVHTRTQG